MPSSKPNLLVVTTLLALAAAATADAKPAPPKGGLRKKKHARTLRRGRIATAGTHKHRGAVGGRGGLEEDVAFWTNLVRRTQDMSVPGVPPPVAPTNPPFGGGGDEGGGEVDPPTPPSPTPPSPTPPPVPGTTVTTPPVPVAGIVCAQGETCVAVGDVCSDGSTEECCGEVFDSFVCECVMVGEGMQFDCGPTDACLDKVCEPDGPGPSPPSPTPDTGGFQCPPASFVGCTAVDPANPVDECPTIGEPCPNANAGEFCCLDACPRNYCTAKQAPTRGANIEQANFTLPVVENIEKKSAPETTTTSTQQPLVWLDLPDEKPHDRN